MRRRRESEDRRINEIELKPWKFDGPRSRAWRLSMTIAKGTVLFVLVVSTVYFIANPDGFQDFTARAIPSSITRLFTSDVSIPEEGIVKESQQIRKRVADTLTPSKKARKGQAKAAAYLAIGIAAEDVLRIEGQPDRMDGDVWQYGASRIYFIAGRVASWSNSSGRPLRVKPD